jgi:hypothetical protein
MAGKLIPCRWDLQPVFTMLDTGVWDDSCRRQLDDALGEDCALDGFTLMLYAGGNTDKAMVVKMLSYDAYIERVTQRLASPTIGNAHKSVREALIKAKDGGWFH